MADDSESLLRAILNVSARVAFPPKKLAGIVMPRGATDKQRQAYNLCDGSKSQADIAKTLKIDPGNFSRTVARWVDEGVVFRLGSGKDARLLHAYPLAKSSKENED